MNEFITLVGQALGTFGLLVTGVGGLVAVIRSWRRGPKEDKQLETEIQDTVTAMAERWLKAAEERLQLAEKRAADAENAVVQIKAEFAAYRVEQEAEFSAYKAEKEAEAAINRKEREQMLDHLVGVHAWIDSGAEPPSPRRPAWVPRTLG